MSDEKKELKIALGWHQGEVTDSAIVINKQKKGQIAVMLKSKDDGNSISAYLSCSDASLEWTIKKLEACGWDPAKHDYEFDLLNGDPSPIKGAEVSFEVVEEEFEGKTFKKVSWINRPGGFKKLDEGKASAFSAKLRDRLLKKAPQEERAEIVQEAAEYPEETGDAEEEIGF